MNFRGERCRGEVVEKLRRFLKVIFSIPVVNALKKLRYLKDKLEFLLGSNPPKTNMTGWNFLENSHTF